MSGRARRSGGNVIDEAALLFFCPPSEVEKQDARLYTESWCSRLPEAIDNVAALTELLDILGIPKQRKDDDL